MLTKKNIEAGRERGREVLPEIQLPWKQQGTISIAQAVFDRGVGMYGRRGYSQEEGEKERKGGEGYHGERSAEAYIKAVNESAGLAPDRSVGLEPRTAEHAHVPLRGRWKPSNASSLLFFLLLLLCRLQRHQV